MRKFPFFVFLAIGMFLLPLQIGVYGAHRKQILRSIEGSEKNHTPQKKLLPPNSRNQRNGMNSIWSQSKFYIPMRSPRWPVANVSRRDWGWMRPPGGAVSSLSTAMRRGDPSLAVKRVIDGDTVVLSDNRRVRLIGVDSPEEYVSRKLFRDAASTGQNPEEIRALGRKAAAFAQSVVLGRQVSLRFEPVSRMDRYGRTLAYVDFVPLDFSAIHGLFGLDPLGLRLYQQGELNALLVEAGYASAYTRFPFRFAEYYTRLEFDARSHQRGLWNLK